MTATYLQTLFTPTVINAQEQNGSRSAYARLAETAEDTAPPDPIGPREIAFIAQRDSFYMASNSESGWPYLQHRGGPPGFVKAVGNGAVAFADFLGNRQYISVGNLSHDDRVSLFFMDYPNRARLKILGRARTTDDPDLVAKLEDPAYRARVERAVVISVQAFDWNCPKHITARFTQADIAQAVAPLHARIADLEAELAATIR
ncbi:MAG: pyridoxamine 5'-phosphate oxidase family protein [Alphaproteobacteria bacterium]